MLCPSCSTLSYSATTDEEKIVSFAANAVDHRGSPADKSKTGGWLPATLILGIEFCERLSTMGIAVNLVTYLIGTMHLPSATSANTVTDFMGTSFLLCLLGDEVGRSLGYGICSISMLIAILIFLGGTRKYRYKRTSGSPIVHILQVIVGAVKKRGIEVPKDVNLLYETSLDGSLRVHHTDQFKFLDKAAIIRKEDYGGDNSNMPPNPWTLSSVTKVEEVKMMIRLLPVWATTIIFWTTYAQMITFSVEQASTMDRNIGGFQIPAGSLTVFFVAAILISLAAYDRLIIPFMKKWFGKPGFTNLQRIGIGLFLSTLGMAAAALAEKKRLSKAKEVGQNAAVLPLSVFLLIPQFFFVGAGEAFIYTGQLDFFITQSPKGMKTMSTGLFLTTLSLGFLQQLARFDCEKVTTGGVGGGKGWVGIGLTTAGLIAFTVYWLY
ncbi:hypothetical protein DH2020_046578 [Rehmannia glutinosa]|uniref:Uncharacterized protein n=1 Tax=Rehmannia glutinosa TaxID=99300 RepID=A0ABR0UAV3_REHGL